VVGLRGSYGNIRPIAAGLLRKKRGIYAKKQENVQIFHVEKMVES
jgi:hypothetical protein